MPELTSNAVAALELLEWLAADHDRLQQFSPEERERFHKAIAQLYNPDPRARRALLKAAERERSAQRLAKVDSVLHETGIRALRRKPVFTTPNYFPPPPEEEPETRDTGAPEAHHCYICKQHYSEIHHFYDQMCPECAAFNFARRSELADLHGRVALLTGGRVKIGYQAGIKLLRCGATLIVTTRFPRDAAIRYAREADFAEWGHRLKIFGLDLRHTPSVEALARHLTATLPRLDFIVNNACQTVRRPPEFYAHMMEGERAATGHLPETAQRLLGEVAGGEALAVQDGIVRAAELSQLPLLPEDFAAARELFPAGQLDQDLQ
ncbi:MAG TPA: SDR family NAD(P)-dependent oxidoreductase, partial [Bryobacteraceae bacterium]|nr:SDR family NAD(P)-dependent oxidoreductase [Bryobacteraceae bacterium]